MLVHEIRNYDKGLHNRIEKQSIPEGAYSNALNILSRGDKWEIRRGYALLGDRQIGAGIITGLHVGRQADSTQKALRTRGKKLEYYDSTTDTWIEFSTNILGSDADGEEVRFSDYFSLAGAGVYFSSPNSVLGKIMMANLGDYADQFVNGRNYKGKLKAKQSRVWMWDVLDDSNVPDKTQIYGSKQDKDEVSDYTNVSSENIGTGDASEKTFTDTLAFKAGGVRRTCFGITVTDSVETFTDDKNGVLVGSAGGTGTINYMTGAISVTFAAAPAGAQAITADYYWEDSADGGICDFRFTTPTRVAGEGFFFPQNDGGIFQNLFSINDIEYCIHKLKTWAVTLTADDNNATNLPFRNKVGIPNHRAGVETGEGIYYIDDTDETDPKFRILQFAQGSTEVMPVSISNQLNLADFRFDKSVAYEWGEYIIFVCRHKDSTDNNRMLLFSKLWRTFDVADYWVSTLATLDGTLVAGDSVQNNVVTLFSGFDDDGAVIPFHVEGRLEDFAILGLKDREKNIYEFEVQGQIAPTQIVDVSISVDRGAFVKIGQIRGDGSYIDTTQSVNVGSQTLGKSEVGGGGDGVTAYNYWRNFEVALDDFQHILVRFENGIDADTGNEGIGYFSVSTERYKDIRAGYQRLPTKYL